MTKKRDLNHRQAFEDQGETYVRKLAEQHKGQEIGHEASAWLGEQEALREDAASLKRDAREEETLEIAKEANRFASSALREIRSQSRSAKWAAIVATIAAITDNKEEIFSIISNLLNYFKNI